MTSEIDCFRTRLFCVSALWSLSKALLCCAKKMTTHACCHGTGIEIILVTLLESNLCRVCVFLVVQETGEASVTYVSTDGVQYGNRVWQVAKVCGLCLCPQHRCEDQSAFIRTGDPTCYPKQSS